MIRKIVMAVTCVVFALLLLPVLGREVSTFLYWLPFGWVGFLKRTLPEVSVNWSGLGMVALCSILLLLLTHYLLKWLFSHRLSEAPSTEKLKGWKAGWSFCLFGSFWLLFCIVLSSSGLFRSLQWFGASKEPFYVPRSNLPELHSAIMQVQMALNDSGTNLVELQNIYVSNAAGGYIGRRGTSWEQFDLVLFQGLDHKLKSALIVPRAPLGSKAYFGIIREDNSYERRSMRRFRETLIELQKNEGRQTM